MARLKEFKVLSLPIYSAGGDKFTIIGTGLSKATRVYFIDAASKNISAASFTVVNDTTITGVFPTFTKIGTAQVNVTVDGVDAIPESESVNRFNVEDSNSRSRIWNSGNEIWE